MICVTSGGAGNEKSATAIHAEIEGTIGITDQECSAYFPACQGAGAHCKIYIRIKKRFLKISTIFLNVFLV